MIDGIRVTDCSVRHHWSSPKEFAQFLPSAWRQYVQGPPTLGPDTYVPFLPVSYYQNPMGDNLPLRSADSPESIVAGHMEPNSVDCAILTYDSALLAPALPNPWLAKELCRAANDWTVARFLTVDRSRLRGAVLVPSHLPEDAAAEIRRAAKLPGMAQVLLGANGLGKAFGHPIYHPIYEAAAEVGLPVAIHSGADATVSGLSHPTAGGPPATFSEYYILASQSLTTHAASLITQGVLDKYPTLKVLLVGGGILWLPHVLWRLDGNYKAKRKEVPWLNRLPSEIFRQHFRIATYPIEKEPDPHALQGLLASYPEYSEVLCYASGYPAIDADSPRYLSERLPGSFLPALFDLNARDVVGVTSPDILPSPNAHRSS